MRVVKHVDYSRRDRAGQGKPRSYITDPVIESLVCSKLLSEKDLRELGIKRAIARMGMR